MEPLKMEKCCCNSGCVLRKCVLFQSIGMLILDILIVVCITVFGVGRAPNTFTVETVQILIFYGATLLKINLQVGVFVGALKRMKYLMIPYLVIMGTIIVVLYFLAVSSFFIFYEMGLVFFIIAGVSTYFYLTINSYYMELADRDKFGVFSVSETTL